MVRSMGLGPELSIEIPDEGAAEQRDGLQASSGSLLEQRIIKSLCEPVLPYIPRGVHPNTISLITHFIAWGTTGLAVGSVFADAPARSLMLVGAGIGMLLSMIGDCLDGMHARNTNQCSKLGEMMDHWLDAIIVPLTIIGITVALELEPWMMALATTTATMVYHGQLVLYHHTGKFVQPEPATGVEGQFGISIGYVGLAALFHFIPRDQPWLDLAIGLLGAIGIIIQLRCNWFYYVRLGRLITRHLVYVAMVGALAAYYLLGVVDLFGFMLGLIFVSFRICGSYVLFTIVGGRFDGNDWGLAALLAAIGAVHHLAPSLALGTVTAQAALPYLVCAYAASRNFVDFARYYGHLKPATA
jgi:phosphatidylglycerophosphate synthase